MADRGNCRWCRARIIWVTRAKTGKRTCLDAEPVENGNLALNEETALAYEIPKDQAYAGKRYRSHFVSCPHAKSLWRNKR
jgi:hypothetical protein